MEGSTQKQTTPFKRSAEEECSTNIEDDSKRIKAEESSTEIHSAAVPNEDSKEASSKRIKSDQSSTNFESAGVSNEDSKEDGSTRIKTEESSTNFESTRVSNKDSKEDSTKRIKTETDAENNHFEKFYDTAFEFIQKTMEVRDWELQRGIETFKEKFKRNMRKVFSDKDFPKSENICAYFRRFSQLSTELSRSKILLALENCEELQSRIDCATLNVVCIGGGTGFEIVGLCSALHEKTSCKELNLSVVDPVKRWESFLEIVRFLLREGNFGRSCEMFKKTNGSVKFFGISAGDTQNLPYFEALKRADVILMKNFLSTLDEEKEKEGTIFKDVVAGMKEDAMLLVIDSPSYIEIQNDHLDQIFYSLAGYTEIQKRNMDYYQIKIRNEHMAPGSNAQIAVFKKKST